jgi:hypothetical protein
MASYDTLLQEVDPQDVKRLEFYSLVCYRVLEVSDAIEEWVTD